MTSECPRPRDPQPRASAPEPGPAEPAPALPLSVVLRRVSALLSAPDRARRPVLPAAPAPSPPLSPAPAEQRCPDAWVLAPLCVRGVVGGVLHRPPLPRCPETMSAAPPPRPPRTGGPGRRRKIAPASHPTPPLGPAAPLLQCPGCGSGTRPNPVPQSSRLVSTAWPRGGAAGRGRGVAEGGLLGTAGAAAGIRDPRLLPAPPGGLAPPPRPGPRCARRHWLARAYPEFAVPYFVYDLGAMFLCHLHKGRLQARGGPGPGPGPGPDRGLAAAARAFLRKELLMVLHHLCMVLVCFPVAALWRQGKGDFFLGCMLMAELSTPFVCLGKVLILYKRQHTLLHKLNGAAMLVTFFCCRVLLFPYLYWAYARHAGLPLLAVPLALPPAYNAAAALLLAPQLYWFGLICRGALRLFRAPAAAPAPGPGAGPARAHPD
ncbi:ceramide synthase isoform X1 [Alligator mississippiensis]|uniref:ceramide synthase isoform X1 n=1 Tax=Alligator mississippiensis TaxID=8496 RepID=UPI002877DA76|nr:ceramide synthase isoform X1 [Alligator mississippiensis]